MKKLLAWCFLLLAGCFAVAEDRLFPGRQIELCMIGDSITWAEEGDSFRKQLLNHVPELAFLGTHTAKYGFSHAGEGGNNTSQVLARINQPSSVPDSAYYHVLIGTNNHGRLTSEDEALNAAPATVEAIVKIVGELEKRPCTRKIFLGSLLPCANPENPGTMKYRDCANREVNRILRRDFSSFFPKGNVVWVEYEFPIREMPKWQWIIRLHPSQTGYARMAEILGKAIRENAKPKETEMPRFGVEIVNLWQKSADASLPLTPGCYTLGFDCVKAPASGKMVLISVNPAAVKRVFRKEFPVSEGQRINFTFHTGYQGYDYDKCAVKLDCGDGVAARIQLEKMRPSRRPSQYFETCGVDSASPISRGEKLVSAEVPAKK